MSARGSGCRGRIETGIDGGKGTELVGWQVGVILMLLLVLQIVGGWFALRMWRFFKVLVDVHAAIVCDLKVAGFLGFATLLRIEQDNDKGPNDCDDAETIVRQIANMARDLCVNSGIDGRRYKLDDLSRVSYRLLEGRRKNGVANHRANSEQRGGE